MEPKAVYNTNATAKRATVRLLRGHWHEIKLIKGHRYLYECWREHGKKRSRYLGLADRRGK